MSFFEFKAYSFLDHAICDVKDPVDFKGKFFILRELSVDQLCGAILLGDFVFNVEVQIDFECVLAYGL